MMLAPCTAAAAAAAASGASGVTRRLAVQCAQRQWSGGGAVRAPYLREYFYVVDQHGQLFLADTKIKNFTSCFKERVFLDFFFRRLRPNDTGRFEDVYPFVSPCGREMNYVAPEDTPVVFHGLSSDGRHALWGGQLTHPFEPRALFFGANGRLYHPSPVGPRALVRSALALELLRDAVPNEHGTLTMHWRRPSDSGSGSSLETVPIPTQPS